MAPTAIERCSIRLFGKRATYELANLREAVDGAPPAWRAEYTFTQAWQLPWIDLACVTQLYAKTADAPSDGDRWHTFLPVSSPVYWPVNLGEAARQGALVYRCADEARPLARVLTMLLWGADRASDEILTRIRGVSTSRPTSAGDRGVVYCSHHPPPSGSAAGGR
jgi:hypothetical protein